MAKQIVFKSKIRRAANIAKEAWETGIRSIAADVKAEVQNLISKPYPPASKPLTPPHSRSGRLVDGITVVVEKAVKGRAAAIVIKSDQIYGGYLERGTRKMIKRPYAQVVMTGSRRGAKISKKWADKIARAAKTKASKSTRKKTGNRRRR